MPNPRVVGKETYLIPTFDRLAASQSLGMIPAKVVDLTVDEFRDLVRTVVVQTLSEMLDDPDEGLKLRDDFAKEFQGYLAAIETGDKTVSTQQVAEKLGLTWCV